MMMKSKKGDTKESSTKDSLSMSGDLQQRHHEEPHETLPIPLQYVDVMRQTQASMNNVSEHLINHVWTEA